MSQLSSSSSEGSTLFIQAQASAYRAREDSLPQDERRQSATEAVKLLEQALSKGLDKEQEIIAHAQIASMLLHPKLPELWTKISKIGADSLPNVSRALAEIERAFKLDAEAGSLVFRDATQRHAYFPDFEQLWMVQAIYLNDNDKLDGAHAYSYLKEKMKMLQYLNGSHLPRVCYQIGYLAQVGNIAGVSIADWFRKSIDAEDFGPESPHYDMYQETKNAAKEFLPHAKKGKCFIATAVYGDVDAAEVVGFREFRDTVLLPTRIGRMIVSRYYQFSPHLARSISQSHVARLLLRIFLLNPLYYLSNLVVHLYSLATWRIPQQNRKEMFYMAKIKVKCPEGHEFYMEDYERKACPKCGRVVVD